MARSRWMLALATCGMALAAHAHHGWGFYGDIVELEFVVAELKLGNPHDRLVATDDENQRWNLLLAPPARNRRFGFDEETLSVGDRIVVTGAKHSSKLEIKVHCINRDGENVLAAEEPIPIWQVPLSIVWGYICVLGMMWAAAKIFRIGVLMYGKPPTPIELIRWIRYS